MKLKLSIKTIKELEQVLKTKYWKRLNGGYEFWRKGIARRISIWVGLDCQEQLSVMADGEPADKVWIDKVKEVINKNAIENMVALTSQIETQEKQAEAAQRALSDYIHQTEKVVVNEEVVHRQVANLGNALIDVFNSINGFNHKYKIRSDENPNLFKMSYPEKVITMNVEEFVNKIRTGLLSTTEGREAFWEALRGK